MSKSLFNMNVTYIYIMEKQEYQELKDAEKKEDDIPDIDADSMYYLTNCCCQINWHHICCSFNCLELLF